MSKPKKPVHTLSLPYPDPPWPSVSADQEQAILRLLLPLLQPIGEFRRDYIPQSKGRGRAGKTHKTENGSVPEWMPELYNHLTIGFNSTVRRLESLAHTRKPANIALTTSNPPGKPEINLSVVFVCRQNLPDIMISSLPLLMATSAPKSNRSKLVELTSQAEAKIALALQQPRVGVLGCEEGAPGAETLLRFVSEMVDAVDVSWLEQPGNPVYYPAKVKTTEVEAKDKATARKLKRKNSEEG
ncbi:hypothetical protein A1O3_02335 [Capronia epimyces CBS 606.96]|uniref:Uncharacterized protein n=1 Tax=Capronia epimyces CBS 606.96 TaxID=1182542 RepID=W9Z422_9EURO|nr:uncharacterized protein A1O3_02335 [Capronia epimyces CBS 606.96]EXJ89269.1 hypothetical protein A1O3_02335 [Capronia epimyces CBS 606.96]